ncbi:MAG: MBL fold metallo-hydrolase [Dehalococcoidia bacterium]
MNQLYILGTGTPTPTPIRFGSAYVLQVAGEHLMFDCGPAATHKLVKAGLLPTQISRLFFTHHHFDHDIDYPCFLLCRWDQSIGAEPELQVFGPTLTETITERLIGENGAFSHDWRARVNAPLSQRIHVNRGGTLPRRPPSVAVRDIGPEFRYEGPDWRIRTATAEHVQPWLDSLAYRLDSDAGSIVFTGDTQPCDSVTELARGADVLVCQCWDDQERMDANGENRGNSGTGGAAGMAQAAGVGTLILTHMGAGLAAHDALEKGIGDVRRIYDGRIIAAEELLVLPLSRAP